MTAKKVVSLFDPVGEDEGSEDQPLVPRINPALFDATNGLTKKTIYCDLYAENVFRRSATRVFLTVAKMVEKITNIPDFDISVKSSVATYRRDMLLNAAKSGMGEMLIDKEDFRKDGTGITLIAIGDTIDRVFYNTENRIIVITASNIYAPHWRGNNLVPVAKALLSMFDIEW